MVASQGPEGQKHTPHQASTVPLLTPTLLSSPSWPSWTPPPQGEHLPRPPPGVVFAEERRRRLRCPWARAREAHQEESGALRSLALPTSPPSTWKPERRQRGEALAQGPGPARSTRPKLRRDRRLHSAQRRDPQAWFQSLGPRSHRA